MKNPVRAKSHNYLLTTRTISRNRVPPSSEELHQILREGTKDFEGWHEAMCDLKKGAVCNIRWPSPSRSQLVSLRAETADWIATFVAGTLKLSNMICIMNSRLVSGSQEHP